MEEEERIALQPRLEQLYEQQRRYLFLLPQNEYANQVSNCVRVIALSGSSQDTRFYRQILDYILACHPPTYVHSMVVARLARSFAAIWLRRHRSCYAEALAWKM